MELLLDISLLSMLVATAIGIAVSRDLLAAVMLSSIYGLLSANFFVTMDAVDVAFTEASVGAGISPLLMFATLAIVGRFERYPHQRALPALLLVVLTGAMLILATLDIPAFGDPNAPAQTHVAPRFINESGTEIGIPNMVTSVLASYRGFDTFGEVTVVFAAVVGVLALLGSSLPAAGRKLPDTLLQASNHRILRIVSKILVAPIMLFALYVQFHGDYGPGGGFQAGVIFAAAIIIYTMLFGLEAAMKVINVTVLRVLAAFGVLLYGSVGLVAMLNGKNFLDYDALAADPVHGQHYGIIVIELGVGITVAAVMILIYFAFAGRLIDRSHKS